jgi:hypothetical protein
MKPGDFVLYKFYSDREFMLILSSFDIKNMKHYIIFSFVDQRFYKVSNDKLSFL